MLPKEHRLSNEHDFGIVKTRGRSFFGKLFSVRILVHKSKRPARFGFVVSTKVSRRAVDRNKMKRMLREIVRKHLEDFSFGFDCVIFVKKSMIEASLFQVESEMMNIFERAGILK